MGAAERTRTGGLLDLRALDLRASWRLAGLGGGSDADGEMQRSLKPLVANR